LVNLKFLNLISNRLAELPPEIGRLKNLRELDLRANQLTEREIEKVRKLLPRCQIES
jgi:Leucine-rich repeat (LRR) protein